MEYALEIEMKHYSTNNKHAYRMADMVSFSSLSFSPKDSSMTLPDGTTVPRVLVVSKVTSPFHSAATNPCFATYVFQERVFMETVGAVQELAKSMVS